MAPRTGPQGVTLEDVQDVADNGRAGYTITRRAAQPAVTVPSAADLAGFLAGNPQPGYGQKYGGLGTAGNLNAAVTGNVYQLGALQDALAARAGQATSVLQNAYANIPMTAPNMYGAMPTAQERAVGSQLGDVRREIALREAARTISPGRFAEQAGDYSAMHGNVLAEAERVLAGRLADAQEIGAQERADEAARYQQNAQRYLAGQIAARPEMQLAENIASISPSAYAQLVATQQYGVNPAVAAGLYGLDYNTKMLAQRQAAQEALLPDFTQNTRELIYNQGGPEALAEYDAQQYANAMSGTLNQQISEEDTIRDLEEAAADNAIYKATALTPGMIYTNRDMADGLRAYMLDPDFQQSVINVRDAALASFQEGEDPMVVAQQAYQQYYESNPDPVAARYIADIAASFAFGS